MFKIVWMDLRNARFLIGGMLAIFTLVFAYLAFKVGNEIVPMIMPYVIAFLATYCPLILVIVYQDQQGLQSRTAALCCLPLSRVEIGMAKYIGIILVQSLIALLYIPALWLSNDADSIDYPLGSRFNLAVFILGVAALLFLLLNLLPRFRHWWPMIIPAAFFIGRDAMWKFSDEISGALSIHSSWNRFPFFVLFAAACMALELWMFSRKKALL